MRTLEEIDRDLATAREALLSVEETPAEVYSRIVGYYRSVRNWNRGKREEYGERRLYDAETSLALAAKAGGTSPAVRGMDKAAALAGAVPKAPQNTRPGENEFSQTRLLLFVRPACPACPSAKEAAGRLGIRVDLVNADTETGFAEAQKRNVFSTPTAIFLSPEGNEIGRALDGKGIADMGRRVAV